MPRLAGLGHELAISANWGLNGAALGWEGFTLYPADGMWNNSNFATHADHHEADLTIALCDAWVMNPEAWPEQRMAIWAPVDHYPIPPQVLAVLAHERVRPIAMSRNGEKLMSEAGLDPAYVPHGIDTAVFRPLPEIRQKAREALSLPPDGFLVGMVGANRGNPLIPRKGFPQAFHAFSRFAAEHEDAWLYVHTQAVPDPGSGINLDVLATVTGCPAGRVRFPEASAWHLGISPDQMAVLYNAFDVLLNPSWGEGFGIPIMEAQACGVPVITSDHSAMSELTRRRLVRRRRSVVGRVAALVHGHPFDRRDRRRAREGLRASARRGASCECGVVRANV